jgi:hypothetical protein
MDHVAGVEDLMVAVAAYEAACRHWPGENDNAAARRTDYRGQPQREIGMTMRALMSHDRPAVREIRFESREAANAAVEQSNVKLKYTPGLRDCS